MRRGVGFTRRGALIAAAGAALVPVLTPLLARGQAATRRHGLTVIGDLKYPADFPHFEYVNPDAPKGGTLVSQAPSWLYNQNPITFNTLNAYVLRGDGAMGMGLTFAALMTTAGDEPGSVYGYVASAVEVSADGKTLVFFIGPEARFHDGTPITADDVVFSIETLREAGHPLLATDLKGVTEVAAVDDRTVRIELAPATGRSLPVTVATTPIFSRAWWDGRDFQTSLSIAPLGSGPYRVGDYRFGNFIEFERVENFWADDLPVMRGRYNFGAIRFPYYRERVAAFEAFKKGDTNLHEEFTSRFWARDYNFPAVNDGRVVREELPDGTPSGAQGWFFNMRRRKFADIRVREALGLAFDFEWTNHNIMFDSYIRTASFFENAPLKAEGLPSAAERALLEPLRADLPQGVFGEPYVPPVSDGSGGDRKLLRQASDLLTEAGCAVDGNRRLTPDGEPFTIEFLGRSVTFEPHHNAYIRNLNRLGIVANFRIVDGAQYTERENNFDFDMTVSRFTMPLFPDEGILNVFSSTSAERPGSRNYSGLANPAVDALLETLIATDNWDDFVTASRALDRVLRAVHLWVPHYYKATHWMAYWDMFARPKVQPRYGRGVYDTWWVDADKAAKLGKS